MDRHHFILTAAILALSILAGCNGKQQKVEFSDEDPATVDIDKNNTIFGVCGDGSAMNTLQLIADNGDTLNLGLFDAKENKQVFGGYACGDRMAVMVNDDRTEATLVINESTLLREWMTPNPIDCTTMYGISIKEGGIIDGIDHSTLIYKSWRIINGQLEITLVREGGGDEEETTRYDFVKLDGDSLIFANDEDRYEYGRR